MQHCGKCGDYNLDESIFCSHCGNRLNYNCPSCSFTNLPQQEFCGGCGKQLADTSATAAPSAPVPAKQPHSLPPPQIGAPNLSIQAPPIPSVAAPTVQAAPRESEQLEEDRFTPYQTLASYALLSLECANCEQLQTEGIPLQHLEAARSQTIRTIEQHVLAAGGQVQISKAQIAFITFKQEPTLQESLQKAIDLSLKTLKHNFAFQGFSLKLKMGLDIEKAAARDPLTSTLERSVSLPGTLTASESAYDLIKEHYRVEPVGPMMMGNRTMQFYRVISAGSQLPEAQTVLESPTVPGKTAPVFAEAAATTGPETPPEPSATGPIPQQGPPQLPQYKAPVFGLGKDPVRTPNIDYTQAIDALNAELSGFLAQGTSAKGRVIALSAEDGLGKSSIIHMVRGRIDPNNEKAIWLGGANYRSLAISQPPLFYWIEVLQNMMSFVFEGQERAQVRSQIEKFLSFIYDGNVPHDEAAFLFDLLSVTPLQPLTSDSRQFNGRLEQFFTHFFKHLSLKRPLILVFEDLQYADSASLELFNNLLNQNLMNLPVSVLITQTPDFYATDKLATALQKVTYKELNISPLSEPDAERFLNDGPLGGQLSEFPQELAGSILRYAAGLPIYLEEGLRLLHLRGVLTVDENTHKFTPSGSYSAEDAFLPQSTERLIRERLDHLSETTHYILQVASVLGERFSVNMLMAISQAEEEDFNLALTTLFNHGYLIPDAVNTGRFRHALIWETVYESLTPEWRQQMHQLISEALEQDFQQELTVNPILIAHHAEQGNLMHRALNFWNLGGIFAGRLGAWTGMNMAMSHALELLRQQEGPLYAKELALRIVEIMGSLNILHEPALAVAWLEWALFYRRIAGDDTQLIEPLGALTSAYESQGDFSKALETLENTLTLVNTEQYPLEAASLHTSKMEYLIAMGRYQQARVIMENSIQPLLNSNIAQRPEFQDVYLQARLLYGQILTAQCDPDTLTYLEETDRLAKEQGLTGLSVAVELTQSLAHLRGGQYELCNREADTLLHAIEQMEQSDWFLGQWGLLAMMYHGELEDWESASQLTLTVLSKAEESFDYPTFIAAQAYAGYISGKLGKIQEARQTMEKALQQASDRRMAGAALIGWRLLADFELSLGNQEVAYELSSKALEVAQKPEIRNQYEILKLSLLCARALLAYGEIKTAGKVLEHLWLQAVQSKMRPVIAECASEIGQLYKQMAHDAPSDLSKKHLMRSTEFFLKSKGIWLELRHLSNVKRIDASIPRL